MKIATRLEEYISKAKMLDYQTLASLGIADENTLRVTLSGLKKKGELLAPVRGVYVAKDADPFWVATHLFPGYVSLSSALYLHQLLDEYPFTIFVASERRGAFPLGQHEIVCFRAKNYLGVEAGGFRLATVEKALYDCLLHAELVGYPKILEALHNAVLSAGTFLSISRGEKGAFFQRLGYLLSLLPRRDREKKRLMLFCRKRVRSNVYLQGRKPGRLVRDWKLVDNVGKEALLAWWRK